nr:zinc-ribbon domain-containing protein [uncultured Dysosmobacter sp.]
MAQWDDERNAPLTPKDVTYGSHQKVWWRCPQGHSYRSEVRIRMRGTGCPVCAGRTVLPEENSLAAKFPDLLSEWDTEKNSPLLPTQVMPGAHRKVWWRCPKGHSWQASVASRVTSNAGCPFCAGQKVLPGFNDLASLHPQLAVQWDRKKNGALTPEAVSVYSNRRVWWLCDKGHSFCAVIAHRVNRESDCPYCTNRKVLPGFNDLETKAPVIASQWHPTLNGSFTPQQVTPGSSRKAWWLCENGHAWKSVISSRTGKQRCGCPVCAGRPLSQCTAISAGRPEKPTH